MLGSAQGSLLGPARRPLRQGKPDGCPRNQLPNARAAQVVRCSLRKSDEPEQGSSDARIRERAAAVLLTGLGAAACLGNHAPALAAPGLGAKSKQIEAELQAILVARGVTLKQLETSPNAVEPAQQAPITRSQALASAVELQSELDRQNAEIARLMQDLEQSKALLESQKAETQAAQALINLSQQESAKAQQTARQQALKAQEQARSLAIQAKQQAQQLASKAQNEAAQSQAEAARAKQEAQAEAARALEAAAKLQAQARSEVERTQQAQRAALQEAAAAKEAREATAREARAAALAAEQAQQLAEQAQRAQLEAQRALQAELDAQAAAAAGEPVGGPELYGVPLLPAAGIALTSGLLGFISRISKEKADKTAFQDQMRADQAEMEGLRGQISNAMTALQREQALVEVLKKEVEKATRGGAVLAGPEGQRLQQLMDEMNSKLDYERDMRQRLEDELQAAMDSSAVLSSRNAELDAELAEERERIQEILESASAALERQREEAQMQRAAYDQAQVALQAQEARTGPTLDIATVSQSLQQEDQRISLMERELVQRDNEMEQLRAEVGTLMRQMADADRALSEQRSLVQRLDAEASAAKRELRSATEASASLAARNASLDEELALERERIQELVEASAAALEHQVSEAQLQAEAQKTAFEEVSFEASTLRDALSTEKGRIAQLEYELRSTQDELIGLNSQMRELRDVVGILLNKQEMRFAADGAPASPAGSPRGAHSSNGASPTPVGRLGASLKADLEEATRAVAELRGEVSMIISKSSLSGMDKRRLMEKVREADRVLGEVQSPHREDLQHAARAVQELLGLVGGIMSKSNISGMVKSRLMDKANEADRAMGQVLAAA